MVLRLQPLRIPTGWAVGYHGFFEVDPTPELDRDDALLTFRQDLLQLSCQGRGRMLDLGWYPDGDMIEGAFRLELYAGDFRGECLHASRSRDRLAVVAEIERLLEAVAGGRL